jgi:hypothetical protein
MPDAMNEWEELDALVGAELDLLLARDHPPVPADPAIDEVMFLSQAASFLETHPDPGRLLAELAERLALQPEIAAESSANDDASDPPLSDEPPETGEAPS